jgi:hypothetical protein
MISTVVLAIGRVLAAASVRLANAFVGRVYFSVVRAVSIRKLMPNTAAAVSEPVLKIGGVSVGSVEILAPNKHLHCAKLVASILSPTAKTAAVVVRSVLRDNAAAMANVNVLKLWAIVLIDVLIFSAIKIIVEPVIARVYRVNCAPMVDV